MCFQYVVLFNSVLKGENYHSWLYQGLQRSRNIFGVHSFKATMTRSTASTLAMLSAGFTGWRWIPARELRTVTILLDSFEVLTTRIEGHRIAVVCEFRAEVPSDSTGTDHCNFHLIPFWSRNYQDRSTLLMGFPS
jgi:hypothetical protein